MSSSSDSDRPSGVPLYNIINALECVTRNDAFTTGRYVYHRKIRLP